MRKKRLNNHISGKRNIEYYYENSEYSISLEELEIVDTTPIESKLDNITNLNDPYLTVGLYQDNEKFIKFSLFFIRKYLCLNKPNSKVVYLQFIQNKIEVVDKLCELLLSSNKKIQVSIEFI